MRRQQLTEAQMAALFDPPIDRRELVRYYTLSEADTAMIRRCRGDHSRLGYALMLCYLRYPGRPLRINERPPAAPISFVAGHRGHRGTTWSSSKSLCSDHGKPARAIASAFSLCHSDSDGRPASGTRR
jgi:hypothetical protein